jgi:predicted Zn-dependent peptidase
MRNDYLEAALSDYWSERLPNGATLAVKRQAGGKLAAATIALAPDAGGTEASEAGYEALALSTAARSSPDAGASLELRLDDRGSGELELRCPSEGMADLLAFAARAIASPAFEGEDFDTALRDARVAERRESGDPRSRAAVELRAALRSGLPCGLPPRGTAASLASATRESVMRYWARHFSPGRLSIAAVGDFEPRGFARALEAGFGVLAKSPLAAAGIAAQSGRSRISTDGGPRIRPGFKALPVAGMTGQAELCGEFSAPEASSPDYPAMAVALAMLDELLVEALRGSAGPSRDFRASLSSAMPASASLTVYKTENPAAAKAAIDAAIADLASGICAKLSSPGGGLGAVAPSLEAYKLRSISSAYAKAASSEGMAADIARDLAAGGDGTAIFRLASRIESVKAEDVVRVAKERLLEGPSAWIALGDPNLGLGLHPEAFAR